MTNVINATEFVDALYVAGVDNWEGYDETISELSFEEIDSDEDLLSALKVAGVDNWEGYEIAMDVYRNSQ